MKVCLLLVKLMAESTTPLLNNQSSSETLSSNYILVSQWVSGGQHPQKGGEAVVDKRFKVQQLWPLHLELLRLWIYRPQVSSSLKLYCQWKAQAFLALRTWKLSWLALPPIQFSLSSQWWNGMILLLWVQTRLHSWYPTQSPTDPKLQLIRPVRYSTRSQSIQQTSIVIYNSCSTNHFLSWSAAGNDLYKEANRFKKSGSDGTLKNICWTLFLQSDLSVGDLLIWKGCSLECREEKTLGSVEWGLWKTTPNKWSYNGWS